MKRAIRDLLLVLLCLVLLLILSDLASGTIGTLMRCLAFAMAGGLAYLLTSDLVYDEKAVMSPLPLLPARQKLLLFLPTAAPCLLLIWLTAFLTQLLFTRLGVATGGSAISGKLPLDILLHVLFPAITEEFIFRFFSLRRLLPFGRRSAVILSALLFAAVHLSLYALPYALVAGVLFALADVLFESLLPSVLLHFINNLASVLLLYAGAQVPTHLYPIALCILSLLSLPFLCLRRRDYRDLFRKEFPNANQPQSPDRRA